MKATGIVRKLDELGRIVIPNELRKILFINPKDPIEIFVENENIILKKYSPACLFCSDTIDTVEYENKIICKKCLDKVSKKYVKENY